MNRIGFALLVLLAPAAVSAPVPVKPVKEFRGSNPNAKLAGQAPKGYVIASKATLEKLWKAWGLKEEMPNVDFTKELVLVATTVGSRLQINAQFGDDGDLRVNVVGTADFGEGFRYQIAVIKSEGVKTINGKPLPKE
jgi:hypothetical protein